MNQLTRPRLVAHSLRDPMAAIAARLEDLPPQICAGARRVLRTATSADHVLILAEYAKEAAQEAEHMLRGDPEAAAYRLLENLMHEAAGALDAQGTKA